MAEINPRVRELQAEIDRLRGWLAAMREVPTSEFESLWQMAGDALEGDPAPSKEG